jgi:aminoglycoside 3-N-acetyltransferase
VTDWLEAGFRAVGVRAGQVVLVHSALRTVGPVEGGAEAVVEALLAVLGPRGTLVAPAFTFAHEAEAEPATIDPATDRSEMGAISEAVRLRPDARRSVAFRHSVAAIGRRAAVLASVDHRVSPFDLRSTFGVLLALDTQVLLLGVTYAASTGHHLAEWLCGVPYRVTVTRQVRLRQPDGAVVETTMDDDQPIRGADGGYAEGRRSDFNRLGRMLERRGAVAIGAVGNAIVRRFALRDLVALAEAEFERDPEVFRTAADQTAPTGLPDGVLVRSHEVRDGAGRPQRHLWSVVDPTAIVGRRVDWEVVEPDRRVT